jgi:phage shock protein A
MGILLRFNDIIKANINAVIDKMEDPSKMIDQYLLDMMDNLSEVKKETANVMAEETRTQRLVDKNNEEKNHYEDLAKKALLAGNEADARVFLGKKKQIESYGEGLKAANDAAKNNAKKMREMHDKLTSDIQELSARREMIKAKVSVAKAQETINDLASTTEKTQGAMNAFNRMENKANNMLDQASAMAELNTKPLGEAESLEEKYSNGSASVDDELKKLKSDLGL